MNKKQLLQLNKVAKNLKITIKIKNIEIDVTPISQFISTLLKAQRQEIIVEIKIKKMKALKYPLGVLDDKKISRLDNYNAGYDKALEEIINSLK